jgi:hypothetical protein
MKKQEVKRTVCSKFGKVRTCHIKKGKYLCAECYIQANLAPVPLTLYFRNIFIYLNRLNDCYHKKHLNKQPVTKLAREF